MRTGSRTTAVNTRAIDGGIFANIEFVLGFAGWVFKIVSWVWQRGSSAGYRSRLRHQLYSAEAPVALLIVDHGFQQMDATEVRP